MIKIDVIDKMISDLLSWLVAAVLIISISLLNMRGARLYGLTTNWLDLDSMLPSPQGQHRRFPSWRAGQM
ncbi:MAG: hypothetical protein C0391_01515 [Anaerolinea sp.]|nr:hypothetical protein [Anaerolinea sp.]